MPEGFTAEVAHELGRESTKHGRERLRDDVIEILEAALLAVVAIATAWSGYQAAKWDGDQAHLYAISSQHHLFATQASTLSGQQRIYDTTTFGFWLQARANGHIAEAALFQRRFRPEYRVAFVAWMKTDPLHNPKAPPGPIWMPQYHNAAAARAYKYEALSTREFDEGTADRVRADKYLRNTVLLATVLFLTAMAQRFRLQLVRIALLGVSAALLGVALYYIASYPVA